MGFRLFLHSSVALVIVRSRFFVLLWRFLVNGVFEDVLDEVVGTAVPFA